MARADGDGFVDTITCGLSTADRLFADTSDIFPASGPQACEIVS